MKPSERAVVLRCLESYPAGVASRCWGYGPMTLTRGGGVFSFPDQFSAEVLKEYG